MQPTIVRTNRINGTIGATPEAVQTRPKTAKVIANRNITEYNEPEVVKMYISN